MKGDQVGASTDEAEQLEAVIRDHDVDENGDCAACLRAGVTVEYPCRVRLVAELLADNREVSDRVDGIEKIDETAYTPAAWRKSSFCENSGCVEAAEMPGAIAIRDSESPEGALLIFTTPTWAQFVAGVKAGEFG